MTARKSTPAWHPGNFIEPSPLNLLSSGVRTQGRILRAWLPVLLWLAVILSASTNAGSAANTSRFLGPVLEWLLPGSSPETRARAIYAIRKLAHVMEYAVLALLLARARALHCAPSRAPGNRFEPVLIVAVCAVVASLDEFWQTFWGGRLGSPRDVALDTLGAALGISLHWLAGHWRRRW